MFKVIWHPSAKFPRILVHTDWKWLIKLAWGKRRVSSRSALGTEAYPSNLTAHWTMWMAWIWRNQFVDRRENIVISGDPEGSHGAKYRQEVVAAQSAKKAEKAKADMALRIDALQAEREVARAAKDFDRADAIRNEIESAGFKVGDAAVDTLLSGTSRISE